MNDWISVKERLPEKDGWYFVYAPEYWGNNKIYGLDGLAYSNFKHNYKDHWGIERKMGNKALEGNYAAILRLRYPTSPEYAAFLKGNFE